MNLNEGKPRRRVEKMALVETTMAPSGPPLSPPSRPSACGVPGKGRRQKRRWPPQGPPSSTPSPLSRMRR